VRAFSAVVLVAGLVFLASCGGSGTPAGIPITITLSASLTSLNPGQSSTITATVANDSSNKGVSWSVSPSGFGALSNQTSTSATYTAPTSVPTATTVTITATSVASPTVTATVQIAVQTSAITISLSPVAPQTINQGQQLLVNATLTNDTSNKGVTWSLTPSSGAGTLTNQTAKSVLYNAPGSVSSNTAVTLTATSAASSAATAALEITVFPSGAGPNVAALNVNLGPAGNSGNLAFVSVTICEPSTTICQTVDDIQVDTGSTGLRILQSAIPGLSLPTLTDSTTGNTLDNCVQFGDGSYLWGPVQQADVKIGSEAASGPLMLMQTVSSSVTGSIPTACSNGNTSPGDENTPSSLEANGILGVGLEPTDCTAPGPVNLCDGSVQATPLPEYFSCPSSGCASTDLPILISGSNQVINPVVLFGADSNGVVVQFPAVPGTESAAPTLSGSLTFGIQTQSNNMLGSATVFGVDANDNFITNYTSQGELLSASFIDSGSSALFFPSTIPVCTDNSPFYCPTQLTPQTATNEGATGTPTSVVNFDVDNADNLFAITPPDAAFANLAVSSGSFNCTGQGTGSCSFDWGLPFFFGNTVFTAIDGQAVSGVGNGPFWAYTKP
jgi:Protein of unknown function (DUF3443)